MSVQLLKILLFVEVGLVIAILGLMATRLILHFREKRDGRHLPSH
jgi:hypothetical protein